MSWWTRARTRCGLAVVDEEGRRGSVVRDISAWKMAGEPFALGNLVVGPVPTQGKGVAIQVEPYVRTDGVAAYLELYSTDEATWKGTTVAFEIADSEDAPALATLGASVEPGRQPTWRVTTGVVPAKALPPGRYVTRAKIARDGKAVGVSSGHSFWSAMSWRMPLHRQPWPSRHQW